VEKDTPDIGIAKIGKVTKIHARVSPPSAIARQRWSIKEPYNPEYSVGNLTQCGFLRGGGVAGLIVFMLRDAPIMRPIKKIGTVNSSMSIL
jgi:hypothetical protein